ncbi:hypothetical protein O0L34_g10812 [Tuta absoluta]|nr:hypothetical protein O0L34_g10812 [Tuta absoluta]
MMGFELPRLNECFGVVPLRAGVACEACAGGVWGVCQRRAGRGARGRVLLVGRGGRRAAVAAAARTRRRRRAAADRALCSLYVRALPLLCALALLVLVSAATHAFGGSRPVLASLIFASTMIIMIFAVYFVVIVANFAQTLHKPFAPEYTYIAFQSKVCQKRVNIIDD